MGGCAMTAPISATPWDLATGEKWKIESADMRLGGDHNNEVIVDAQGNVVAYVSGNNDEGGNGALLAAAPALRDALLAYEGAVGQVQRPVFEKLLEWKAFREA